MSERAIFTSPIEEISYEMVSEFCQEGFEEDIDLDYKSDWPKDFERLLCSFANTQGGIALIGVEEDNKSRKPICPPVGIEGKEDVLRQRALNIGFDAVYPPVIPEVQICKIPETERSVVLVRISPSRLMHAVDRRSRIYIRVKDSNRGYELASLSDLKWLWDRNAEVDELKEYIIRVASERSNSPAIGWKDEEYKKKWFENPRLIVTTIPSVIDKNTHIDPHFIMEQVTTSRPMSSSWKRIGASLPGGANSWRSVAGGVSLINRGSTQYQEYLELEKHGLFYAAISLDISQKNNQKNKEFIMAFAILAYLEMALNFAARFYTTNRFRWPITINANLIMVRNVSVNYKLRESILFNNDIFSYACPDNEIQLLTEELSSIQLPTEKITYTRNVVDTLFWAFGNNWSKENIEEWYAALSQ